LVAAVVASLALAGFMLWAVSAGGYPAGVAIPAVIVLGVVGAVTLAVWRIGIRGSKGDAAAVDAGKRLAWALGMFVLGVLMGWLCGEFVGYLLLPVLWFVIAPRAKRHRLLAATLPPFGLGFVTLPSFFLALDLSTGYNPTIVLWFGPELLIGLLLMATYLRSRLRTAPSRPSSE
jgi:hypothetical protein